MVDKPPQDTPPGDAPKEGSPEALHNAAISAVEAWQTNPTDETKTTARAAVDKAKTGFKDYVPEGYVQKVKVPEKYELKLPENSKLEVSHLEKIAAQAKARGLSNEDAQALVEMKNEDFKAYEAARSEDVQKTIDSWPQMVKDDPEIGGDAFNESIELSKRVVTRIDDKDGKIAKFLNESGWGNHPDVIRIFRRFGKLMTDDQLVLPGTQSGETKTTAQILYPEPKAT